MGDSQAQHQDYIRGQAGSALLGAGFMLFFGFGYMGEPTGTDLFGRAAWVFFQTLRIGGVAMLLTAGALISGRVMALLVDAVVAGIIGLLFIATGAAMAVDGGDIAQTAINLICGYGFATSARRNWIVFQAKCATGSSLSVRTREAEEAPRASLQFPPPLPRGEKGGSAVPGSVETESLRTSNFELPTSAESETSVEPPESGGFLAALADKKRKQRDDASS